MLHIYCHDHQPNQVLTPLMRDGALLVIPNGHDVCDVSHAFARVGDSIAITHTHVTMATLAPLVKKYLGDKPIETCILDMDGNEYWILKALLRDTQSYPTVIVTKFQDILGPVVSQTIPYQEQFRACKVARNKDTNGNFECNFAGASLVAFMRLLEPLGYRLVSLIPQGYVAFFIHCPGQQTNILHEEQLPSIFAQIPKVAEGMRTRFPSVQDMPWQTV